MAEEKCRQNDTIIIGMIKDLKDDFIRAIESLKDDNNAQHKEMISKQDYTNGKVRKLALWKATIVGIGIATSAFIGVAGYVAKVALTSFQEENKLERSEIKSLSERLLKVESKFEK